ncbi:DUF2268 domain-containing protein [Bacillus sp. FJAT-27251]|uniref:DUF2268 domain-containing protein n=1 Tax=Bacillus sp. FJAT-27251 TaxID=1684142 RepID=UPI0006A7938E|nr:DUF2268 domain-containing protein [Bacillus sp. FJAT-27251]
MSVIRTDRWLAEAYDRPIEICGKLTGLFDGAYASEIYDHLLLHGMYYPLPNGKEVIKKLQERNVWRMVGNEAEVLQELWEGPDIPIYIFPSDTSNTTMNLEFNGKSGLAFRDKLFLFISEENDAAEIKSLLTHEYNHVCRLTHYPKHEGDYTLLDSIILEGLAEHAVRERFGEKHLSSWISLYTDEELLKMWEAYIAPNRSILKTDRKHHQLMYGSPLYPKMAGYSVGYYLVGKYAATHFSSSKDMLSTVSCQFSP